MASLLSRYARLPRATQRILLFLGASLTLFLLFNLHQSQSTIILDASSAADRRADSSSIRTSSGMGLGHWLKKTLFRPSKPSWLQEGGSTIPPAYLTHHGPNLSRLNKPPPRRTHRGLSRTVIEGSNPEQYNTAPLPTIEEAFARLHPILKKIKDETPAVPREHELWSPLFPPYVTKEQQNRFQHLRAIWDEDKEEWVEVERRWMLVTVCRQVAGESFFSIRSPRLVHSARQLRARITGEVAEFHMMPLREVNASHQHCPSVRSYRGKSTDCHIGMLADWFAMWTVLADYLGPESLSFSLLEGGSDDGR